MFRFAISRSSSMSLANFVLRCPVNSPIREALVADAFQQGSGSFRIAESGLDPLSIQILDASFAVVVAEIKLMQVTLQVLFADVMERADHATLEDGEKTFNRVRGNFPASVFLSAVV